MSDKKSKNSKSNNRRFRKKAKSSPRVTEDMVIKFLLNPKNLSQRIVKAFHLSVKTDALVYELPKTVVTPKECIFRGENVLASEKLVKNNLSLLLASVKKNKKDKKLAEYDLSRILSLNLGQTLPSKSQLKKITPGWRTILSDKKMAIDSVDGLCLFLKKKVKKEEKKKKEKEKKM